MAFNYTQEYLEKRNKWASECWYFVTKAEYKKASNYAKKGLKQFPNDVVAQFNYYSILADYALTNDSKKFKQMHKDAIQGMQAALNRKRGVSPHHLYKMKNELYFQTKQFKKQYMLGLSTYKKTGELRVLYSSGVGAANYAIELALKNKKTFAQRWAMKSVEAWGKYFLHDKKYYNPYVHLALAYGVLGENRKMMNALKKSSKLCKKPMSYFEFSWTINTVSKIPYLS